MRQWIRRLADKSRLLRNKMNQYQKSITFAEAGETEPGALSQKTAEQPAEQPGVLLVIGNEGAFSRRIMDYALDMAQRMSYRLVALSRAPVPEAAIKLLSPPKNKIEEFEQKAAQNAAAFAKAAENLGIPFEHIVKFGETDAVIQEVARQFGGVEFVVSEPAEEHTGDRAQMEDRPDNQVYVYTMV